MKRRFRKYKRYCHQCKKVCFVPFHKKDTFKFCSRKCQRDGSRKQVIVECFICGKPLLRPPHRLKLTKRFICSKKCKGVLSALDYPKVRAKIIKGVTGKTPWNKGLYIRCSPKTEFKRGHKTWNKGVSVHLSPESEFKSEPRKEWRVPVGVKMPRLKHGSLTTIMEKVKDPIWNKKKNRWELRQLAVWKIASRMIWERYYGKIPEGNVIFHKDGDPANNAIGNLKCITRAELLNINQYGRRSNG